MKNCVKKNKIKVNVTLTEHYYTFVKLFRYSQSIHNTVCIKDDIYDMQPSCISERIKRPVLTGFCMFQTVSFVWFSSGGHCFISIATTV